MYLVLIDTRIPDCSGVIQSLAENTEYILFDYEQDTYESLQSRITGIYDSVAIIQHNYEKPTFQFLRNSSVAELYSVLEIEPPDLPSWSEFIGFIQWLTQEHGAQYIDLLLCNVWSDPCWKHVIETIRSRGIYIRASANITGEGGDFILESDNFNMIGVYFTDAILNYPHSFLATPIQNYSTYPDFTPYVFPPSNPGRISSKYKSLLGGIGILDGTSHSILAVATSSTALAFLLTNRTVVGVGNTSSGATIPTGMTNITKIIGGYSAFAALREDGTVYSWGYLQSGQNIVNSTDTAVVNYNTVSASLQSVVDVVATTYAFAALKSDGSVILWGQKNAGAVSLSNYATTNISRLFSMGAVFYGMKTDGNVVTWNGTNQYISGNASASAIAVPASLLSAPIVDILFPGNITQGNELYVRQYPTHYRITNISFSYIYDLSAGVVVLRSVPIINSAGFFVVLSNKSVIRFTLTTSWNAQVFPNTTDVISGPNSSTYALLDTSGNLSTYGDAIRGGNYRDATYGIPTDASVNNIVRFVCSNNNIGVFKSDNKFVFWGGGIAGSSSSRDFATKTQYSYATKNVATVYDSTGGFLIVKTDSSFVNLGGYGGNWYPGGSGGSVAIPSMYKGPGNNIENTFFQSDEAGGFIAIDVSFLPVLSPTIVGYGTPTDISYYVSNPSFMGHKGRIYSLIDSSGKVVKTHVPPTNNTHTYVFKNASLDTLGTTRYSIVDTTNISTYQMASFDITVQLSTPGAPIITSVSSIDTTSFNIYFTENPSNGGSPVTDFAYSIDGGSTYQSIGLASSPITVNNASIGTTYPIVMTATSNIGTSSPSATYSYTLAVPPGLPTFVSLKPGSTFIDVSYNAPAFTGGSPIIGYRYSLNGGAYRILPSVPANTFRVTGLTNGLRYNILLDASNSAGFSEDASGFAIPFTVPDRPLFISVKSGDRFLDVSFSTPYNGGSPDPVIGYRYSINSRAPPYTFIQTTDNTFRVSGLTNGTRYVIFLDASNEQGYSTDSSAAAIPFTVPSAPTSLVLTATVNSTSISMTCSAPDSSGGSVILGYRYTYSPGGSYYYLATRPNNTTISGLTIGTTYTVSVDASNAAGYSPVVEGTQTPYGPPGTPQVVFILGSNKIDVSFNDVSANGRPILGYRYRITTPITRTGLLTPSTPYNTITGLVNGTTYSITLDASNIGGYSTSPLITTATPRTIPSPPQNLRLNARPGAIDLSFSVPASNGGNTITGYRYYYSDSGTTYYYFLTTTQFSATVNGLTNGQSYTIYVDASNAAGYSDPSFASAIPYRVPDPPTFVSIVPGNRIIDVSYSAPAFNGGNGLIGYRYALAGASPPYTYINVPTTTPGAFRISDVSNAVQYNILLDVSNAAGFSEDASGFAIPYTVPNPPVISSAIPDNRQITVSFAAPAFNGGRSVSSYQIRAYNGITDNPYTTIPAEPAPYTITDLSNGVAYQIQMRSVNLAGDSSTATYSSSVVPRTIPDAPIIVALTPGNTIIDVSYSAPENNGGNTIIGYRYSLDGTTYSNMGASPYRITGLSNGQTYIVFIDASNAAGYSDDASGVAIPRTVPSAPKNLTLTLGDGTIQFVFETPDSSGGDAILGYRYLYSPGGSYAFLSDTELGATISGLNNGTSYTITVDASNAAGYSAVASVQMTPYRIPDVPTIDSLTPGNQSITIAYSLSFDGGTPVIGYRYSIDGGDTYTTMDANPYTIYGLTNGTEYTVQVDVSNIAGYSATYASATSIPRTIPTQPQNLALTPGPSRVQLSFTDPSYNGGNQIIGYRYSYTPNDRTVFLLSTQTTDTIFGLIDGTQYTFFVDASNAAGYSTPQITGTVIPRTTPSAPNALVLTPGNESIGLTFQQPDSSGGNAIIGYRYSYTDAGGNTYTTYLSNAQFSDTIIGVTNGTAYTIYLDASNEAGYSSQISSSSIPRTIPDMPNIVALTPGNTIIDVSYSAPAYDGGNAIIGYRYALAGASLPYTYYNVPTETPGVFRISGLTNATQYNVLLDVSNAAGYSFDASGFEIPYTVPNQPTISSAVPDNRQITVSFSAPGFDGGRLVLNYQIRAYDGVTDNAYTTIPAEPAPYTITDLSNGAAYQIQLRAVNLAGISNTTTYSSSVVPRTVPDAPTLVSLTPNDQTITVDYAAPENNGGNTIIGYRYSTNGGTTYSIMGPSPYTITGLSNGQIYNIFIDASNAAGDSTDASGVAVPRTIPSAPTNLVLTHGDGNIQYAFSVPASDGGNTIVGYRYTIGNSEYFYLPSTQLSGTITGLNNGTQYTFILDASNAAGYSPDVSAQMIPYRRPNVPTIDSLTPGDQTITIAYSLSFDGGSAVIGYRYSINEGNTYTLMDTNPYTIYGLTNGQQYTVWVDVSNADGYSDTYASATSIPRKVPTSPQNLVLTHGNNSASFVFDPPSSDGGNAIIGYRYTYYNPTETIVFLSPNTRYDTITGLTNGTAYEITVDASNVAGYSPITSGTIIPYTIPGTPTNLELTPGNESIQLTFQRPDSSGGNAITGYRVRYTPGDGTELFVSISNLSATITGLTNGTEYTVSVDASNADGYSAVPITATMIPRRVADPPIIVAIVPGDTYLDVSYNAPANNGGNALIGYRYKVGPTGQYEIIPTPDVFRISSLTNGQTYTVYIDVSNAAGYSADTSGEGTPRTIPTVPNALALTPGNGTIQMTFQSPSSDGGNTIIGYRYTYYNPEQITKYLPPNELSATLTGLTNGAAYTVSVDASNAAGYSVYTDASAIPYTVPDPPTIVSLTPGDTTVSVAYAAPAFDGGRPVGGYRYSIDGGNTYTTMTTNPYTITNLTNGIEYTIFVDASNAAGDSDDASGVAIPRTMPGPPKNLVLTPGNGTIGLVFESPDSVGGNAIIGYRYTYYNPTQQTVYLAANQTLDTISGLTNGESYTVTIDASNVAGYSTTISEVAIPFTVPDALQVVSLTPGNGTIEVAYQDPSFNGGRPVIGYRYSLDETTYIQMTSNPYTITGLQNGQTTVVWFDCSNLAGDSTDVSGTAIPYTVPDALRLTSLTPGNGTIEVAYQDPSFNGGRPVIGYRYSLDETTYIQMTSNPYTITGLQNGQTTRVWVDCSNLAGDSTDVSGTAIPFTVPDAPTIVSLTPGNRSITVVYSDPAFNGGREVTNIMISTNGINYSSIQPSGNLATRSYTINSLTNGQSTTVWLRALNQAGESVDTSGVAIPYTVPNAPILLSLTPSNQTVDVSFADPSFNGGRSILGYRISLDVSGASPYYTTTSGSYRISNLTNGNTYTIRVDASNIAGYSANVFGDSTPYTIPNAPILVSLTPGNQTIDVSFDAPLFDGGRPVIGYRYSIDGTNYYEMSSSPYRINGLQNGQMYTVRIDASNIAGFSTDASGTEIPYTVPNSPILVSLTPGNETIDVSFAAPLFDGGRSVIGYRYSLDGTNYYEMSASPYRISGLQNGQSYTVRIDASNIAGYSDDATGTMIPYTVPGTPRTLTLTPGNRTIQLAFLAPTSTGGNAIVGYRYWYTPGSGTYYYVSASTFSATITGLTNGTNYTVYVDASNAAGYSATPVSAVMNPYTVPDAPQQLILKHGNQRIDVSFSAPSFDGGNGLVGYLYRYWYTPGSGAYNYLPADQLAFTLSGLTNGTEYTVYVNAANPAGNSEPTSGTMTPYTIPGQPSIVSLTPGNQTITVDYSAPGNNGGNTIVGYRLSTNGGNTYLFPTASPYTITGLTNGVSYTIWLDASNAEGYSTRATGTSIPRTVPQPPQNLVLTRGDRSFQFSFNEPASDGGNAITGYQFTYSPNGQTILLSATQRSGTISGLTNGTTYTITIYSQNDAGVSSTSTTGTIIPYTIPGTPNTLALTPGNQTITATFLPPDSSGGNAIIGYRYSYSPNGGTAYLSAGARGFTLTGLTNGIQYTVNVDASNAAGYSATPASSATIPYTNPEPPSFVLTPGDRSIAITYTAPANNGGNAIIGYRYSIDGKETYTILSSNPQTISGLINGTEYTVWMDASNAAGYSADVSNTTVPFWTPSTPRNLVLTPSNESIRVAFDAPISNGGKPLLGYRYNYSPNGKTVMLPPNQLSDNITGLTNGTVYTVWVDTSNQLGYSERITGTITPFTVPNSPILVSLTGRTDSIIVEYSPPTFDGGSPITGYRYSLDSINFYPMYSIPYTIPGLANGGQYTVWIVAENAAGYSPYVSGVSMLYTVPGIPTNMELTIHRRGAVQLSFSPPDTMGDSPIIGYRYWYVPRPSMSVYYYYLPPTENSVIVSGMADDTEYTFYLEATNSTGYSDPATATIVVPPAPVPNSVALRSSFGNNATVYYKPNSLPTAGAGPVANTRSKAYRT